MLLSKPGIQNHYFFILFYLAFVITGLFIYQDFGISWDEIACRRDMAIVNYDFIFKGHYNELANSNAKYHGPSFEMILYFAEKAFHLNDSRDIYLMRHLLNFLLFALSVLFFYLLCLKRFKKKWIAALGPVLLVLSPRIFADAFYNSKDLAFLSMVIISLYTTTHFLERKSYTSALINAFVTAFMIDIRIMGVIVPFFTYLMLFSDYLKYSDQRKKLLKLSSFFLIFLIGFILLFWPILWRHPVDNFISAFKENSKFPWDGYVFYLGENIPAKQLPWHYLLVWMIISTPILYTLFFLSSLFFLAIKLFKQKKLETAEWLNLYVFFLPIAAVLLLHSIIYDGWRHLYFVYPSFIFVALLGIEALLEWGKNIKADNILKAGIIAHCLFMIGRMVQLHPFENLYFNPLAGNSLKEAGEKFVLDYWGLSYKQGMSHILESDSSDNIAICSSEFDPLHNNILIFPKNQRDRLRMVNSVELSDYFITSYNYMRRKCDDCKDVFNIVRDDGIIFSGFNIKSEKLDLSKPAYHVATFSNNFDSTFGQWSTPKTIIDSADGFSLVEDMDSTIIFGSALQYTPDISNWNLASETMYMKVTLKAKSTNAYSASIVFQVDSVNDQTYVWNTYAFSSSKTNSWNKHEIVVLLPDRYGNSDKIKVYCCNTERVNLFLEDIEVNFYSVPNTEIPSFLSRFK